MHTRIISKHFGISHLDHAALTIHTDLPRCKYTTLTRHMSKDFAKSSTIVHKKHSVQVSNQTPIDIEMAMVVTASEVLT